MSKHNKQRYQQTANSQSAVKQQIQPTIKVIPEIETTEEGEKILKESLEKMDSYVTSKKAKRMHIQRNNINKPTNIMPRSLLMLIN